MGDYIDVEYTYENKDQGTTGDIREDTRSDLYVEVINSALKYDYVWLGRTPARGNESFIFGPVIDKLINTKKMERYRNEACILNIFTWTGLIGVILYFVVFVKAIQLSLFDSNNFFIQLVGLYIGFRWLYAWVEDYRLFDNSTFILWICLGLSLIHI